MPEITASQVHELLTGTHEFITSGKAAVEARNQLGGLFLDVARQAQVGLRDLAAVTGLHHSTIRAMIQRAIGPGLPDGWKQEELPIAKESDQKPATDLMTIKHGRDRRPSDQITVMPANIQSEPISM